ncbi:MAG: rhodanese-like domain-containing protein [Candidatus Eremiobacteraeota bacterium]|nr:rhodanese-like domain-containing protein [Candidatus Eremiobacteraeota bacterium]
MSLPAEISVIDLQRLRHSGAAFTLLDVRDDDEVAFAPLGGATHVPMKEIPGRLDELKSANDIVVFCHSGGRSAHVCEYLRRNGFPSTANLIGGIDAWSRDVDPAVPRY